MKTIDELRKGRDRFDRRLIQGGLVVAALGLVTAVVAGVLDNVDVMTGAVVATFLALAFSGWGALDMAATRWWDQRNQRDR